MEGEIRFGKKVGAFPILILIIFSSFPWLIPFMPDGNGGPPGFSPKWIFACSLLSAILFVSFGRFLYSDWMRSHMRLVWNADGLSLFRKREELWKVDWCEYRGCKLGRRGRIELVDRSKRAIATFGPEFFDKTAGPNRGKLMAILKLRTPSGGTFDLRPRSKPWNPWVTRGLLLVSCIVLLWAAGPIRADWLKIQAINRGEDVGYVPGTPILDFWAWGGGVVALMGLIIAIMEFCAERRARVFKELGGYSRFENPPNLAEYFLAGSASPYWLEEVRFHYADREKAKKAIRNSTQDTPGLYWAFSLMFLMLAIIPFVPSKDGTRDISAIWAGAIGSIGFATLLMSGFMALQRAKRNEAEFLACLDDVIVAKEDRISLLKNGEVIPLEISEFRPRIFPFSSFAAHSIRVRMGTETRGYRAALMDLELS